jgi:hypothetical protein
VYPPPNLYTPREGKHAPGECADNEGELDTDVEEGNVVPTPLPLVPTLSPAVTQGAGELKLEVELE